MKKYFSVILLFVVAATGIAISQESGTATAGTGTKPGKNNAFTYGEKITYTVKYSLYLNVNVGEVQFEIADKPEKIAGADCYRMTATGRTYGFYDPFYKVRDKYESYVDAKSLVPYVFIRNVHEGSFKFSENVVFNHKEKTAKSLKRTQSIPEYTQDVLSAIYIARTFDYANATPGQSFFINTFLDDTTYYCGVKYIGKENIKTSKGTFRCVKLQPILVVGNMFKSSDEMVMWVTDDDNRIPVRIESGISVGSIKADLSDYSGLRNALTAKL